MKTYKHPILGRTALLYNEYINDGDCYYCSGIDDGSYSRYYTEKELKALGFEEVNSIEVPEWFVGYIKGNRRPLMPEEAYSGEYQKFLKHYPKKEELPIQEIMKKLEEVYYFHKEAKIGCDGSLLDDFEKVLRTYAIQDTSQSLLPLDIEKVAQRLEWNTCTHIHHSMHKSVGIAIRQILSEYGTPKITE